MGYDKEERVWGEFYNLLVDKNLKVKELIIFPKKGMSFQKHFLEMKFGLLAKGLCRKLQ